MPLERYEEKRDFSKTPEPSGAEGPRPGAGLRYVIQKHDASRLHYDFRLELDGVLLSWAVPKGPSFDSKDRRLAVRTEDHPLDYADFEGVIPEPEYGAGTVIVWDTGTWEPQPGHDPRQGLAEGDLKILLYGQKLAGKWVLVRMKPKGNERSENWLLIKERDDLVRPHSEYDVLAEAPDSAVSGRSLEEVEAAGDSADQGLPSGAGAPRPSEGAAEAVPDDAPEAPPRNAVEAPLRRDAAIELATLVDAPPTGEGWLSELKYDGYRALVVVEDDTAAIYTRSHADWTDKFAPLASAAASLPASTAVLDGEIVAFDDRGVSSFGLLQDAIGHEPQRLAYAAFDLLYLNGFDIRGLPLRQRKELLATLLAEETVDGPLHYVDHVEGQAGEFHDSACGAGLEGSVCKRADSRYVGRRTRDWLKVKCRHEQEVVIGGFTDPGGSRKGFGALLVGYYEGDRLIYAGRVGTGFSEADLEFVSGKLRKLERAKPPFADPPSIPGHKIHWVKPALVAQTAFREWTSEGVLRQASFKGLREDKLPTDVVREDSFTELADAKRDDDPVVADVTISNPQKKLLPGSDATKLDLARYYEAVAGRMLPHAGERLLTLVRCPSGKGHDCFYQRHPDRSAPSALHTVSYKLADNDTEQWLYATDPGGLVALAQMGAVEIHTWQSRVDALERPDQLVFDLDPGEGVGQAELRAGALLVREVCEDLGFATFLKSTGGKGLHIVCPVEPVWEFDRMRALGKAIVDELVEREPKRFVGQMARKLRTGRIFVDYLRNALGASAVAPYSTRNREGGPCSLPLAWEELTADLDTSAFTVEAVLEIVGSGAPDPWRQMAESSVGRRVLTNAEERLAG